MSIIVGSQAAQASMGWIQVPGLANQISVGASDYPWVRDANGYAQYLDHSHIVCSTTPPLLCVEGQRQWVFVGGPISRIAADLYGKPWSIANGALSEWPTPPPYPHTYTSWPVNDCLASFAPGFVQWPQGHRYAFGSPAPSWDGPSDTGFFNVSPAFEVSCSHTISQINFHWNWNGINVSLTSPNGVQSFDFGETQVTLFTVEGSTNQIPWIVAPMSDGVTTVWAVESGNFRAAPPPTIWGISYPVTYATDHHVVAGNAVWRWNGDAHGNRGNPLWTLLALAPAGHTITQIAYASAIPNTPVGPIGPSHLWMVDSNQIIYQYGEIGGPVK